MSKLLDTDQQISKLTFLMQLAEGGHDSDFEVDPSLGQDKG